MYSRIKIFGHPVHPMLVDFPIVLYTITFVGFVVYGLNDSAFAYKAAYYANWIGIFAALLAAVPGSLDWFLGIPRKSAASRCGLLHGSLNVTALLFFLANALWVRGTVDAPLPSVGMPLVLTGIGLLLTVVAGWHGFALISRYKVGVELNAEQAAQERDQWRRSA